MPHLPACHLAACHLEKKVVWLVHTVSFGESLLMQQLLGSCKKLFQTVHILQLCDGSIAFLFFGEFSLPAP